MGPMTEAVLAFIRHEERRAEIAQQHQVPEDVLRGWRDRFIAAGEVALGELVSAATIAASREKEVQDLKEQVAESKRTIRELLDDHRFLEKQSHATG